VELWYHFLTIHLMLDAQTLALGPEFAIALKENVGEKYLTAPYSLLFICINPLKSSFPYHITVA
jgi:hypothetical protein